ncbi:ferredoxin [Micromonospora sp. R77]|uniref:ferredoxin n=1 Tax=Micromonospora sp. R77 TaxID=2925836 RepID=UPI001F60FF86|nr:ferredoxin [Micromonospora sp. R77]MCI4066892.1 ferredoxin [Micromonospora sp. R77]
MDSGACVGAGLCVLTAPEVFDQDPEDGIATAIDEDVPPELVPLAREARAVCPVEAIGLTDD